jgi:hypothetical protein
LKDSESDDGDDAGSSDAASRSPSPVDLERSSYSPIETSKSAHTTTTTTTLSGHSMTNNNQLSSRILNHPSTARGSAGKFLLFFFFLNFKFISRLFSSNLAAISNFH